MVINENDVESQQLFGEESPKVKESEQSWNESCCSFENLKEPDRSSCSRKRTAENDENAFAKILKAIDNIPAEPSPSDSPMTNFLASLNNLTRHFTREQQIDFQLECLNLVKKIDKGEN